MEAKTHITLLDGGSDLRLDTTFLRGSLAVESLGLLCFFAGEDGDELLQLLDGEFDAWLGRDGALLIGIELLRLVLVRSDALLCDHSRVKVATPLMKGPQQRTSFLLWALIRF